MPDPCLPPISPGERELLVKQIQQLLEKQEKIKDQYLKLSKSLDQTEEMLRK